MKICFFGSYDKNYSKNVVLLKGLKKKKISIVHCYHPQYFSPTHYPSLFLQFCQKARDADMIFVAFFGHYDVWFAWMLGKIFRKKVIFDPLVSIYNTRVEDRRYFKPETLRAKFYVFFDLVNTLFSDLVILDTYEHFKYFHKMFGLKKEKVAIVRVGADEEVLIPTPKKLNKPFKALFYGSYQPSQGALKIIQSVNLLKKEEIDWIFIGQGQQRSLVENYAKVKHLKKVTFLNTMPFQELIKYINSADIIFGVFGNTIKSKMVIHNKIYQGAALGKVVITQDTRAVREIFTDKKDIILTQPNKKDISQKIIELLNNQKQIRKIEKSARQLFLKQLTSKQITDELATKLKNLML